MKLFVVLAALVAVAVALPQRGGNDRDAVVVRLDNDNIGLDKYNYAYETSNGIQQQESGELRPVPEGDAIVVRGSYSYVGDDGVTYTVNYIADENGFQPQGAHIPQK